MNTRDRKRLIKERLRMGWSLDDACNIARRAKQMHQAKNMSLAELSRKSGVNYYALRYRLLHKKMNQIDAICEPLRKKSLTKKQVLDAKRYGLGKMDTCERILKCDVRTLNYALNKYQIDWVLKRKPVAVTINGITYSTLIAACDANGIAIQSYWSWRKTRKGTTQELLQQYIDFRAEKKHKVTP